MSCRLFRVDTGTDILPVQCGHYSVDTELECLYQLFSVVFLA